MTGYYAQQTAADVMTPGKTPAYTNFLPEYLKPLGYRSYHSGKWHLKFVTGPVGVAFEHLGWPPEVRRAVKTLPTVR